MGEYDARAAALELVEHVDARFAALGNPEAQIARLGEQVSALSDHDPTNAALDSVQDLWTPV